MVACGIVPTSMTADYEIRELPDSLLVRTKRRRAWRRSLVGAAITGLAVLLTLAHILPGSILTVVVFLAVLLGLSEGFGQAAAELRVTPLEFQSRGNLGAASQPTPVCSADIHWLEYQPDCSGPDTGYRPGGLYAKLRFRTVCVLPLLDENQTIEVIGRIKKRFPEMARGWSEPSIGDRFTTLRLGQE